MVSPAATDKPVRRSSSSRWNPSLADVSRLGENCYFYAMRGEVRPVGARAPMLPDEATPKQMLAPGTAGACNSGPYQRAHNRNAHPLAGIKWSKGQIC